MTIPRVKKCLEGDDGLTTLCRLYDYAVEHKEKHMKRRAEEIGQIEAEIENIGYNWNSPNLPPTALQNEINWYVDRALWKANPKTILGTRYMTDYNEQKEG